MSTLQELKHQLCWVPQHWIQPAEAWWWLPPARSAPTNRLLPARQGPAWWLLWIRQGGSAPIPEPEVPWDLAPGPCWSPGGSLGPSFRSLSTALGTWRHPTTKDPASSTRGAVTPPNRGPKNVLTRPGQKIWTNLWTPEQRVLWMKGEVEMRRTLESCQHVFLMDIIVFLPPNPLLVGLLYYHMKWIECWSLRESWYNRRYIAAENPQRCRKKIREKCMLKNPHPLCGDSGSARARSRTWSVQQGNPVYAQSAVEGNPVKRAQRCKKLKIYTFHATVERIRLSECKAATKIKVKLGRVVFRRS